MTVRPLAAVGTAVTAALGSAVCCAGPLVAVSLGVSGAGLAHTLDPLRPYLVGVAAVALVGGHWAVRREDHRACEPGAPCADLSTRRRMRILVWAATVVAAASATFPYWSRLVL
jgi:mercuric ion transport protein